MKKRYFSISGTEADNSRMCPNLPECARMCPNLPRMCARICSFQETLCFDRRNRSRMCAPPCHMNEETLFSIGGAEADNSRMCMSLPECARMCPNLPRMCARICSIQEALFSIGGTEADNSRMCPNLPERARMCPNLPRACARTCSSGLSPLGCCFCSSWLVLARCS